MARLLELLRPKRKSSAPKIEERIPPDVGRNLRIAMGHSLSGDVIERLLRNPGNFEIKHFANRTGARADFLAAVASELGIQRPSIATTRRVGSVLAVLTRLVAQMNSLPDHVKRTRPTKRKRAGRRTRKTAK